MCQRSRHDPHWCQTHQSDYSEESEKCQVMFAEQRTMFQALNAAIAESDTHSAILWGARLRDLIPAG